MGHYLMYVRTYVAVYYALTVYPVFSMLYVVCSIMCLLRYHEILIIKYSDFNRGGSILESY